MKVVNTQHLHGTERAVKFNGGVSLRAFLESDGLGFAIMKTIIPKGGPYKWHYKNHLEACYCISGFAILKDLKTGVKYDILPGVVYALDDHDPHEFEALEDTILISVFNPPLTGLESHDINGVYHSETTLSRYHKSMDMAEKILNCKNVYDAAEIVNNIMLRNKI